MQPSIFPQESQSGFRRQCAAAFKAGQRVYISVEMAVDVDGHLFSAHTTLITQHADVLQALGKTGFLGEEAAQTHQAHLYRRHAQPFDESAIDVSEKFSPKHLSAQFNKAKADGLRYLAVLEANSAANGTVFHGEYVIKSHDLADIVRNLRERGLRPDGRRVSLRYIFDTAGADFETQIKTAPDEMLRAAGSDVYGAYQRYLDASAEKNASLPEKASRFGSLFGKKRGR